MTSDALVWGTQAFWTVVSGFFVVATLRRTPDWTVLANEVQVLLFISSAVSLAILFVDVDGGLLVRDELRVFVLRPELLLIQYLVYRRAGERSRENEQDEHDDWYRARQQQQHEKDLEQHARDVRQTYRGARQDRRGEEQDAWRPPVDGGEQRE